MKKFFTRSLLVSVLLMATSIVCAQKKVFCEDFQSEKLPTGWTTTGTSWKFQNGEALFSSMLENASDTLITPIVSVAELTNNPTVTIDYRLVTSSTNKADVLTVLYRTATSEAWTLLATLETNADTTRVYHPLPATVTADVQIAFAATYQAGKATAIARVAIENQRAEENAPTKFMVDNVSATTATLRWEPSTSQYWEQNYLKVSTTPMEDLNQKADVYDGASARRAYHTLSSLLPATKYYAYVRYECEDNDVSPWANVSFRTQCVPVAVPYSEDFETNKLSECYTIIKNSTKASISKAFPHNGERAFQFVTTKGNVNYLFFPILDVEKIQDYQVSFAVASEVASSKYARELTIGVAEDMTAESFTSIKTISLPKGRQYENVTISLASYTGTGKIVVFRAGNANLENHILIDDVTIETADKCPKPMFLSANNITANSARISWVEAGNASEWNMVIATKQYSNPADCEADAAKGEFAGSVVTNPYEATNLLPETTYYVYVQSACAENAWTDVISFTTSKPVTLPYNEKFDRFSPDFYTNDEQACPEQWLMGARGMNLNYAHNRDTEYDGYQALVSTDNDHTNSAYVPAALKLRGTSISENQYYSSYAMLPAMPVELNKLMLSFWAYSGSGTDTRLIVGVADVQSSDIEAGKQFAPGGNVTPIDTLSFTVSETWEEFNINLSKYQGKGRYITFYTRSGASTPSIFVDDIVIDYAPTCFAVQNLIAEATSTTSFKVAWKEALNATSWNVKVSSTEIDPATTDGDIIKKVTVDATPEYKAEGLIPNTTYYVYVSPVCGDLWSNTSVTTQYSLMVPYYNDFSDEPTGSGKKPQYWITGNRGEATSNSYKPYVNTKKWSVPTGYTLPAEIEAKSLYFYAYYNKTASRAGLQPYAILPELSNADVKDVMLSFWGFTTNSKIAGYCMELKIGVMADPTDFATLTEVTSVMLDTVKVPQYFFVDMSSYTGNGKYIVLYMDNQTTNTAYFSVDNLCITLASQPRRVTDVQAIDSTITETAAKLRWHENGNAKSWKIRLFTEEQTNPLEGTPFKEFTANDTIFGMTGLSHSTQYFAYVQSVQGSETGAWSLVTSFWTECGKWETPYFENFESYATGSSSSNTLTPCYDVTGSTAGKNPYVVSPSSLYGGGKSSLTGNNIYFFNADKAEDRIQLVFPKMDKPVRTLQLTCLAGPYCAYSGNFTGLLSATHIGVVTPDNVFHEVTMRQVNTPNVWDEWSVNFSSYDGEEGRIAMYVEYDASLKKAVKIAIDNVKITEIPECERIQTVEVEKIGVDSALISWKKIGKENAWNLKVSSSVLSNPSETTADVYDGMISETKIKLKNLAPGTDYYVYVQSVRSDVNCVGEWSREVTFSTHCAPVAVYSEDFENYKKNGSIPGCYILSGDKTDATIAKIFSPNWYISDNKALDLLQTDISEKNYCALPLVECKDVSELQLSMLVLPAACGTEGKPIEQCPKYFFEVGVMTDPHNPNTYVALHVDSIIADGSKTPRDRFYTFKNYGGDDYGNRGKFITLSVLPYKSSTGSTSKGDVIFDNIRIEKASSCVPPTGLKVVEFDDDTVKLIWDAIDSKGTFRVRLFDNNNANPDVDKCVAETIVTDTTVAVFKGLIGNTRYYAFARRECGGDDNSIWCHSISWLSSCENVQPMPYVEDFESYVVSSAPQCWTNILSSPAATVTTSAKKDGEQGLYINFSSSKTAKIVTPKLDIATLQDLVLYFDVMSSSSTKNSNLIIEAVESTLDNADAVPVYTFENISGKEWTTFYLDLKDLETVKQYKYLRFSVSVQGLYMDNLCITNDKQATIPVQKIRLASLSTTEAAITFTEPTPSVNQWIVEYGLKGFTLGEGTQIIVDTTMAALTRLTPNTSYDVYVRANRDNASVATPLTFSTTKQVAQIPYYYNFANAKENEELWTLINVDKKGDIYPNIFTFGDAKNVGGTGSTALYVQHDGKYGYMTRFPDDELGNAYDWAVRYIDIPQDGTYTIGIKAKNPGCPIEKSKDNALFSVSLVPSTYIPVGDKYTRPDGTTASAGTTKVEYSEYGVFKEVYGISEFTEMAQTLDITKGTYMLLIYWRNYSANYNLGDIFEPIAVDSVWIEQYHCTQPYNHTFTNISDTSATLSWSAGANRKFEIVVSRYPKSAHPDGLETNDKVVHDIYEGASSYTVTGLQPNTSYSIYQRTICSDGPTPWHEERFTTNCVEQALPYTELFAEDPMCWHLSAGVKTGTVTYVSKEMKENDESEEWQYLYLPINGMVVLPDFGVEANRLRVTMNVFNNDKNYYSSVKVGVVTSPLDIESFEYRPEWVYNIQNKYPGDNAYILENFDAMLHRYQGHGHYIAIKGDTEHGAYIKDITVTLLPECVAPMNVEVINITETSALVNWIGGNEEEWMIALNTDTFVVTENPYDLSKHAPLTQGTTYSVSVRAHCDATHVSDWTTPVQFTTVCGVNAMPLFENFEGIVSAAGNTDFADIPFNCWQQARSEVYLDSIMKVTDATRYLTPISYSKDMIVPTFHWSVPAQKTLDRNFGGRTHIQSMAWHKEGSKVLYCKWLLLPTYAIEEHATMSFDLAFALLNGKSNNRGESGLPDFCIVASIDDGKTFSKVGESINLAQYDSVFRTVYVDLSDYAGKNVKLGFYHTMSNGGESYISYPSIRIADIRLNCAQTISISDDVCQGHNYVGNGFVIPQKSLPTPNMSKTFSRLALSTTSDCDSVIELTLTTLPSVVDTVYQTICEGESYSFGGQELTQSTPEGKFATYTYPSSIGCDSTVYLQLTVNPRKRTQLPDVTIKHGESYSDADGHFVGITEQGIYRDTLVSAQGCDSIVELRLFVTQPHSAVVDTTVCENNLPFTWHDIAITEAGIYPYTIAGIEYDSVVSLNVKVNAVSQKTITEYICHGDSILFDGKYRYAEDTYTQTLVNALGCDSIVTLNLFVTQLDTIKLDTVVLTTALPFVFEGKELLDKDTPVGVYERELMVAPTTAGACSTVYHLHITVKAADAVDNIDVPSLHIYPTLIDKGQSVNLILDAAPANNNVVVEIHDMVGQLVATYRPASSHVVLGDFHTAGMYFVRVLTDDTVSGVGRVVVK